MKNLFAILVLSLFLIQSSFAQSPQLVNYQAVARDLSGNPLITTPINITFDVLQGSSSGTLVYSETHIKSTNQFGLFTAEIGGGTPVTGTFGGILWGSGLYYLRVTVNGDVMPANQLLSVPYALHAATATSGVPGANGHANLADSIAEPSGVNCPNGGYLIYMGADDNDDNILQPLERDIQYYICNGLDGTANNNDTSATNELQTLSISNDTIFLTSGGFVVLPASSGSLWNINTQGIDYTAGNVGVGNSIPAHKLTVNSSDSIIASFNGNNSGASVIGISNTNPGAVIGTIFLSGTDTAIIALDPTQKLLGVSNNMNGGHIGISSDSTIASYSRVISQVAQDLVFNNTDSIFNISPTGNIININQGTFVTDSLYLVGNNKDSTNWILANVGLGQAKWTNPNSLGLGGGLWTQGIGDVYNNTDSIGIGVVNPSALLHVSGGGLSKPIALFEKGGFLSATININNTSSNTSGINFQNGGTTTSSIFSATTNVLSLNSQFVEVGNSPKTGTFNVAAISSAVNPTVLLHESSTGFSRIKHTNTVANKYWIVEAGINASNPMSGYSIGYNNGVSTSLPLIVYGDSKVGINNIATPLGSFHVMDNSPVGNGMISEGFNQSGLLVLARNNFSSPNRGAIVSGDQMGKIVFTGYHSSSYGNGPNIYANATENFTSSANGSEIIFNTTPNGTASNIQALRLLNDGRVEIPVALFIPTGAGNNKVLMSDPIGNASWQTIPSLAIWSKSGSNIFQNTLTDFVGIGTNTPQAKLHVVQDGHAITAIQSSNNNVSDGGQLSLLRTRGTSTSPLGVQNGDRLGKLEFVGMDNVSNFSEAASIRGFADETFGSTSHGSHLEFHTTPIGVGVSNEAMRINSDGNLGIGVSAPEYKLDVDGAISLRTLPTTPVGLAGRARIWYDGSKLLGRQGGGGAYEILSGWNVSGANTILSTNTTGNVGIGTPTPSAKLDVNGTFKLTDGSEGAGKILTSDALGNASWKTSRVAFEAHASGVSVINSGILQFGTEFFDDGANYNNTTGVFTAPVNGIYSFNLSVMAIVSISNGSLNVTLRKNGVDNKEQTTYLTSGQPNSLTIVTTMKLTAGDTIDIRVNSAPAGTGIQSSAGTWFSGHLVYAN